MTISELQSRIEQGLPGARVEIQDPMRDGVHLKAVVRFAGFSGRPLLEQHRMVYELLREELKGELHALALETRAD
ncbi:MAG: BolA/IbaG family iron-sulfur metabolism protein [Leptospirales bacterium]|nr:BolA/IbaG family iron-sulfur metabolism protein [Leptospirales bacterium]